MIGISIGSREQFDDMANHMTDWKMHRVVLFSPEGAISPAPIDQPGHNLRLVLCGHNLVRINPDYKILEVLRQIVNVRTFRHAGLKPDDPVIAALAEDPLNRQYHFTE